MLTFHIQQPLGSWKTLGFGALALVTVYGVSKVLLLYIKPIFSPLRTLPGPKNASFLWGNIRQILNTEPGEVQKKWAEEYGPVFVYRTLFNRNQLFILDTKALSHILNQSYTWQKPPELSANLAEFLGEGLLAAEGDVHKIQRRILNPSFSLSELRELTPIFLEKSAQLRDIWLTQASSNGGSYNTDVLEWFGKVTLDIIGLAGFNYEFNALNSDGEENELAQAFNTIFKKSPDITALFIIREVLLSMIPVLRRIPTKQSRDIAKARKAMERIGSRLVEEKKNAVVAAAGNVGMSGDEATKITKGSITSRDLLSRLVMANMATDVREERRLSDKDVVAQIPTFLLAGHETTASAMSWCLYSLAREPEIQEKLRKELRTITSAVPSMEELNALPYLDAVVREINRLHPAVFGTARMATKDDIIPLGTGVLDKRGVMRNEIRVSKGEFISIPIQNLNTYKGIWGDDADDFRPDRWLHLPEKATDVPGVWGNVLTFIGGPRSCIGYRFALMEMKCLIWTLVSVFSFEFVDPAHRDGVSMDVTLATRPKLKSEAEKGSQLPLKVTPLRAA